MSNLLNIYKFLISKANKFLIITILLLLVAIDVPSLLHYIYVLILLFVIYNFTLPKSEISFFKMIKVFHVYLLLSIFLYALHLIFIPEYFGFSGGLGVGTDDSYYYSLIAVELPNNFPVREGYWFRESSFILFIDLMSPIKITHPLHALLYNILAYTMIPIYSYLFVYEYNKNNKLARVTSLLTLFCPFIALNSSVFIRDGWVLMLFIGALYYVLDKQLIPILLFLTGAILVRLETGLLTLFIITSLVVSKLYYEKNKLIKYLIFSSLIIILGIIAIFPSAIEYVFDVGELKNVEGLFREEFISFLKEGDGNTILLKIYSMPQIFSIPLSMLYFLLNPFLSIESLVNNGYFVPRSLFANVFALMMIIYIKYFIKGIIVSIQRVDTKMVTIITLLMVILFVVSQLSMQIRHKMMLMPLFYLIVSFGILNESKIGTHIGNIASVFLLIIYSINIMR